MSKKKKKKIQVLIQTNEIIEGESFSIPITLQHLYSIWIWLWSNSR